MVSIYLARGLILPYMHEYNHTNYTRLGPVTHASMHQLPKELNQIYKNCDVWVITESNRNFCQVGGDQGPEWFGVMARRQVGLLALLRHQQL